MRDLDAMTELDRTLTSESELVPSSGFTASVMSAIRDESEQPPIPFPWKRFAVGFALSLLTAVLAALWIVWQPATGLRATDATGTSVARLLATTAGALLGTFALLRATRVLLRR